MNWGEVELEAEVRDWIEGLTQEEQGTVAFYVDLLEARGVLLGEPYSRQLDGKLRELRFHLGDRDVRITYWIAPGRRIILSPSGTPLTRTTRRSGHDDGADLVA